MGKVQPEMVPVAAFVVVFASKALAAVLVAAWPATTSPPAMQDVLKIAEAVKELRSSHAKLSQDPDTFEHAARAKEKLDMEEMKLRRAQQKAGALQQSHNQHFLLSLLDVLGPAVLVIVWWATPVYTVAALGETDRGVLWPLGALLRFPNHPEGVIGIIPWVFVCQRTSEALLGVVTAGVTWAQALTTPPRSPSIKDAIEKLQ